MLDRVRGTCTLTVDYASHCYCLFSFGRPLANRHGIDWIHVSTLVQQCRLGSLHVYIKRHPLSNFLVAHLWPFTATTSFRCHLKGRHSKGRTVVWVGVQATCHPRPDRDTHRDTDSGGDIDWRLGRESREGMRGLRPTLLYTHGARERETGGRNHLGKTPSETRVWYIGGQDKHTGIMGVDFLHTIGLQSAWRSITWPTVC